MALELDSPFKSSARMSETTEPSPKPRILIVEDEPFIAMLLGDMLEELGYSVTAAFSHVAETLDYLASAEVDIALLDVNLGTEKIDPIADLLAARNCPFIFTTGYGQAGVPQKYADNFVLQKPFQLSQLADAIKSRLAVTTASSKS
jgi:CheY-like chemotaxis protein